jgi:hypothetical protein
MKQREVIVTTTQMDLRKTFRKTLESLSYSKIDIEQAWPKFWAGMVLVAKIETPQKVSLPRRLEDARVKTIRGPVVTPEDVAELVKEFDGPSLFDEKEKV